MKSSCKKSLLEVKINSYLLKVWNLTVPYLLLSIMAMLIILLSKIGAKEVNTDGQENLKRHKFNVLM
jgi:hypothetical protein